MSCLGMVVVVEVVDAAVVADGLRRMGRSILRMLEGSELARVGWSGGTKMPSWRKVLALEVRIREEAEGERRMIGSPLREGLGFRPPAVGAMGLAPLGFVPGGYWPGRVRLRPRKISAVFRTWEKSWLSLVSNLLSPWSRR